MSFTLAIVGRPNVGKSTLFNRLVGKRLALVDDRPGITRDWREGEGKLGLLKFRALDTAGLEEATPKSLEARMFAQTESALKEADAALFMIDGRAGTNPGDEHFANWLRRWGKPVRVIANKCEGAAGDTGYLDAFGLGLGDPIRISAEHGEGISELIDALKELMEASGHDAEAETEDDRALNMAIVGRPNVGKSTLINSMIGEARLLVGPEAGLTRDSISVSWEDQGRRVRLYDTAGMRRKAKIVDRVEKMSVADGLHAVRFAHVVVLVLDATVPFDRQDRVIAHMIAREGRAAIIALNKWDLIDDQADSVLAKKRDEIAHALPPLWGVPVLPISAKTGRGLDSIMPAVWKAIETWNVRVPTSEINRWLETTLRAHAPPAVKGRRVKLRYITQTKARPPTFLIFCNRPDALKEPYRRYLTNSLREAFDLWGVPIRLRLKKSDNPYARK